MILEELEEIREKYGDERRTEITGAVEGITNEDLIVEEDMVVTVSHLGYVKRNPITQYRAQRRGGKGAEGHADASEEDFVESLFVASTHAYHPVLHEPRPRALEEGLRAAAARARRARQGAREPARSSSEDERVQAMLPCAASRRRARTS